MPKRPWEPNARSREMFKSIRFPQLELGPEDFLPLLLVGKMRHGSIICLYKSQEKGEPPAHAVCHLTPRCSLHYLTESSRWENRGQ